MAAILWLVPILFSTYLYFESRVYRDPIFRDQGETVLSVPANIEGFPVRLVHADTGDPIEGFIVERRFVLQNVGNLAIRPSDVTLPLRIRIGDDGARLLSALVTASTRPEVVQAEARAESERDILLSFAILEGEDAFEVTAIVSSDEADVDAEFIGAVEGAGQVGLAVSLSGVEAMALVMGVLVFGFILVSLVHDFITTRNRWKTFGKVLAFLAGMAGFVFAVLFVGFLLSKVWEHFIPASAGPPEMEELSRPIPTD